MPGILDPSASLIVDTQGDVLNVNPNGSISTSLVDGTKFTYSSASGALSTPTSATDIATLTGSSTKTIRVLRVEISGTQTTDSQIVVNLIKRLSPNTGGTASTVTSLIGHDSNSPLCTATRSFYSANPVSLGSPSVTLRSISMYLPASLTAATPSDTIWTFGDRPGQSIVLRGTNELLAVNLNSATIVGGSLLISMEWTEE